MPKPELSALRRVQLDRQLAKFAKLSLPPKPGWIREIRQALGMTGRQLASRLGVRAATVTEFERSEVQATISLKTLARIADAMDCRLIYALVPREGSLEQGLRAQARRIAERRLAQVTRTMELEAQGFGARFREREVKQLVDEMIRTLPRDLWEPTSDHRVRARGNTARP